MKTKKRVTKKSILTPTEKTAFCLAYTLVFRDALINLKNAGVPMYMTLEMLKNAIALAKAENA